MNLIFWTLGTLRRKVRLIMKEPWLFRTPNYIWLVVSTHLKNISQNVNLPQVGVKIKNIWNHHLEIICMEHKSNGEPSCEKIRQCGEDVPSKTCTINSLCNSKVRKHLLMASHEKHIDNINPLELDLKHHLFDDQSWGPFLVKLEGQLECIPVLPSG